MSKAKSASLSLPSNLSYLRCIEPTEGVMFSVAQQNDDFRGLASIHAETHDQSFRLVPVEVAETTVRGTISHDHADTPASRVGTGEKALNAANIATIEQAKLAGDADMLYVQSTVRFSGHSRTPSMCNEPSFVTRVNKFLDAYQAAKGYEVLALRYVLNLASGSWIWRNRFGDNLEVRLQLGDASVVLKEQDIDLGDGFSIDAIKNDQARAIVGDIVSQVARALAGEATATIEAAALVTMGTAAEVYPSQEFSSDGTERTSPKNEKILSKIRFTDGRLVATIHARKIGNAIRSIDTWHGVEGVGAIAIEPFGANTHQSQAYRAYDGKDLYSALKDPERLEATLQATGLSGTHHFVAACLIRGGVYGFASASKKAKAAAPAPEAADAGAA